MTDFDAVIKEVENLRVEHGRLQTLIPQLEEEINGLRQTLDELHRATAKAETELEDLKAEIAEAEATFERQMDVERKALTDEKVKFENYTSSEAERISLEQKEIIEQKSAIAAKQTELDSLLQKQVEDDKRLSQKISDYQQKIVALRDEEKVVKEAKVVNEDMERTLSEWAKAIGDEVNDLEKKKLEAEGIIKEAEAKQSKANKALAEAKERKKLVSLEIDEYQRKNAMLEEAQKRVAKKEVALNDRAAVYASQQK